MRNFEVRKVDAEADPGLMKGGLSIPELFADRNGGVVSCGAPWAIGRGPSARVSQCL